MRCLCSVGETGAGCNPSNRDEVFFSLVIAVFEIGQGLLTSFLHHSVYISALTDVFASGIRDL